MENLDIIILFVLIITVIIVVIVISLFEFYSDILEIPRHRVNKENLTFEEAKMQYEYYDQEVQECVENYSNKILQEVKNEYDGVLDITFDTQYIYFKIGIGDTYKFSICIWTVKYNEELYNFNPAIDLKIRLINGENDNRDKLNTILLIYDRLCDPNDNLRNYISELHKKYYRFNSLRNKYSYIKNDQRHFDYKYKDKKYYYGSHNNYFKGLYCNKIGYVRS